MNKVFAASLLALALLGCGGDGGGTVTPVPAPTPVPSPTPTPSAYPLASDFTHDRSFDAIGLRVHTNVQANGTIWIADTYLSPETSLLGFDFTAANRTYAARFSDDKVTVGTTRSSYSNGIGYDAFESGSTYFFRSPSPIGMNYVGYVDWYDEKPSSVGDIVSVRSSRYLIFGARTKGTDLPLAGTIGFDGQVWTYGAKPSEGRLANAKIDYVSRTIEVSTVYQTGTASTPITMTGVLDPATGRISGATKFEGFGSDGNPSGRFEGALYGPSGAELGIIYKVDTPGGTTLYGYLLAKQD